MENGRITNRLAFACGVGVSPLSARAPTCFRTSSCDLGKTSFSLSLPTKSHTQRAARFLALGAPPPPPPPPSDNNDASEGVSEGADAAGESTGEDASQAEGGQAGGDNPAEEVTADDILNSPSFLKKKLELVQKELIELKSGGDKADEALNEEKQRYVRLVADFENYRRRSVEDIRQQDAKSTAKVCKEILNVLDNFERANKAVKPETEAEQKIVNSYQSISKQLLDALVRLKVEPIDAIGTVFDPQMHEAIQRMESNEYAEDVVCQQYSRGYQIGETLIRAAVVGVSIGPGPADGEGSAPAGDDAESPAADAEPEAPEMAANQKVKEEVQQAADGL